MPETLFYFRMIRSLDFLLNVYAHVELQKNHQKTSEHPVLEL